MKRAFSFLIAVFLCICLGINITGLAFADNSQAVTNVHWKEGSAATAEWGEFEGADYYRIQVFVYCKGNLIGNAETGTSDNEIDIQQEIHIVADNKGLDVVQVAFSVIPFQIVENTTTQIGSQSPVSTQKEYWINAPTLGKPQNLQLSEECVLSWDEIPRATRFYYWNARVYNGDGYTTVADYIYHSSYSNTNNWSSENGRSSFDFAPVIRAALIEHGLTGEEYNIDLQIKPFGKVEYNGASYSLEGELSDYSNKILFKRRIPVEAITLSPASPILYRGNSYYLGKTITPEDAHYESISWTTSDSDTVAVDPVGLITGIHPGKATVTAAVDAAYDSVEVTVYEISSNIEDPTDQENVTDTAGDIIDDIANNDNPDIGNTDIEEDDLDEIKDDIQQGIWRGDEFFTDLTWYEETFGKYKNNWGQIQKAARELNAQFAGAYTIEVEMHHKDKDGTDYHIGNITELENEITFTFDLPTGMSEIQSGYARKFVIVRIHNNAMDTINPIVNDDSTFTAKSDRFSDFVLLYFDVPKEPIDLSGYSMFTLPESVSSIEDGAFEGISAEVVIIPKGCISIGDHAFANCQALKYVVIPPNSDVAIHENAFAGSNVEILYQ